MIAQYTPGNTSNTIQTHSKSVGMFNRDKVDSYESKVEIRPAQTIEHDGFRIYCGTVDPHRMSIHIPAIPEWTKSDARRLGELVEKYALGTISHAEADEEKRLQRKRRITSDVPVRSYDEMIRDARRKQALAELMTATENYVREKNR